MWPCSSSGPKRLRDSEDEKIRGELAERVQGGKALFDLRVGDTAVGSSIGQFIYFCRQRFHTFLLGFRFRPRRHFGPRTRIQVRGFFDMLR